MTNTALVQIEKPVYGGACLARSEGKVVFVPLTLPGETARVRIVEEKRGYSNAELVAIERPAPERVNPGCRHFDACGGCQYQHASYEMQLRMKQAILRETLERGDVPAPETMEVLAGASWRYRNRIRLTVNGAGQLGYRGRRSHDVVPIRECPIAAPVLVEAALTFNDVVRPMLRRIQPNELTLFCNAEETGLLVSVVTGHSSRTHLDEISRALSQTAPALKGIEFLGKARGHERPHPILRWGDTSLTYRAAKLDYRVDQGAFFQVNRWLVDRLIEHVTSGRTGKLAWDLFAGVGLFARKLAAGFECVVAVESAPLATEALVVNLKGTGNAEAVHSSTLQFLQRARNRDRPDLIVVDPPRSGLGVETTALLAKCAAPTLVYVSCDPPTLARDLRVLLECGYSIGSVTLVDLFPQTFHLETVVELYRS